MKSDLISELKKSFESVSDSGRAVSMSAYMKNLFPFYGISAPQRNEIVAAEFKANKPASSEELENCLRLMWNMPQREWQYAAVTVLIRSKKFWNEETAVLIRELAVKKSWWDTVDTLSSNCAGPLFLKFPQIKVQSLQTWEETGDMWLIRMCILHQLNFRDKTDAVYLAGVVKRHAGSDEFFIRKAIGWALRQYAKTNPEWVIHFTRQCKLKPLSLREALKNIV